MSANARRSKGKLTVPKKLTTGLDLAVDALVATELDEVVSRVQREEEDIMATPDPKKSLDDKLDALMTEQWKNIDSGKVECVTSEEFKASTKEMREEHKKLRKMISQRKKNHLKGP